MDDFVSKVARGVGRNLRDLKRTFDKRIGRTDNPHIMPYRGYGNDARIIVMGRTMRDPGLGEAAVTDDWRRNLINSYKRLETDELSGARVRATFGSVAQELVADDEGFFRVMLPLSTPPAPDAGYWHNVQLELVEPTVVDGPQPTASAPTLVPPADAQFGIISDLDDTVIQTGATSMVRMLRATLLANATTRVPFAGVAAFYAALQRGATGTSFNPIFYVSSSPWNLYDVLEQFLGLHRIPTGPTLLRDWGMSLERIPIGHAAHKISSIRQIMEMYPTMSFILVGDSGQEDPEIYREIAREYPQRILAAYIRDVTAGSARAAELTRVARDFEQANSKLIVAGDTIAAARHAAESGWIAPEALPEIADEKAKDTKEG